MIKHLNKCRQLFWVLDDKNIELYLKSIREEINSRDNYFKDSLLKNEIDEFDKKCKKVRIFWEKEYNLFKVKLISRVRNEKYSLLLFKMDKYFYQIRGVILSSFEWEKFDNKRKTIIQTFTEDINNMNFLGELTYSSLGIVNGRIMIKDCVKPKKEEFEMIEDFIDNRIKGVFRN